MARLPEEHTYLPRQSDKYCAAALICLTLALLFLSIIVFTFGPTTVLGLLASGIGVLFMFGCIILFVRYQQVLKQEAQD